MNTSKPTIGWIGLGAMGLGMACCAARKGFAVVGHSRGRQSHQALSDVGGRLDSSISAVAAIADIVCVNVFDDIQVNDVLFGQGVLTNMRAGSMLIIHTTGDPALAARAQAAGPNVEVLDAAFSGTPAQAQAGTLTIMAGGAECAFKRAEPLLRTYATETAYVGGLGSGQRLKLINNLLFAAHVQMAGAAYALASDSGFDAQVVCQILSSCSGASRALQIIGEGGAVQDNLTRMRRYLDKDVQVARTLAQTAGLDLGLIGEVTKLYGL